MSFLLLSRNAANPIAPRGISCKHEPMARWTFLTHHAHVLVAIANDPDITVDEIAANVGITSRATTNILNDLVSEGYLERERVGRKNHYTIKAEQPLRHPSNAHSTLAELIDMLRDAH